MCPLWAFAAINSRDLGIQRSWKPEEVMHSSASNMLTGCASGEATRLPNPRVWGLLFAYTDAVLIFKEIHVWSICCLYLVLEIRPRLALKLRQTWGLETTFTPREETQLAPLIILILPSISKANGGEYMEWKEETQSECSQ